MRYTIVMNVTVDNRIQEQLGKNLRTIREKIGYSQEQVAEHVGISVTYYAGIERGEENPTLAVIRNLCKVLNVKSKYILPF